MAAIAVCALFGAVQVSSAATYTYMPTNSATHLWSAGTNWDATPVGNPSTVLTFVDNNATVLDNGLVNTNTNDIAGAFLLNALNLQGTGPAGGAATINVGSSSTGNYLNFEEAPLFFLSVLAELSLVSFLLRIIRVHSRVFAVHSLFLTPAAWNYPAKAMIVQRSLDDPRPFGRS